MRKAPFSRTPQWPLIEASRHRRRWRRCGRKIFRAICMQMLICERNPKTEHPKLYTPKMLITLSRRKKRKKSRIFSNILLNSLAGSRQLPTNSKIHTHTHTYTGLSLNTLYTVRVVHHIKRPNKYLPIYCYNFFFSPHVLRDVTRLPYFSGPILIFLSARIRRISRR